uniref:Uncharacterized protein n=1 Tax=Rhizophora mucronata TaxID=61149 RepID=A0A2P2NH22_RHIMU
MQHKMARQLKYQMRSAYLKGTQGRSCGATPNLGSQEK